MYERRHVSIRELRNRGGEVVERASDGEPITITRDGRPVAELRGLPPQQLTATQLLARWKGAPHVDPARLRRDIDATIDPSL